jgi:hypothetical protein
MALAGTRSIAVALTALSLSIIAGCSSPQASTTKRQAASTTSSTSSLAPPPTIPVTTAPPTTQAVVASIRCQPSELRMGIGPPVSPETGEHPLLLTLTNEGPGACYLDGYPSVTLYDANNALLPLSYQRHGYQTIGPAPQRVDIAPGSAAFVMVSKYQCDAGDRETPPSAFTSSRLTTQHRLQLASKGNRISAIAALAILAPSWTFHRLSRRQRPRRHPDGRPGIAKRPAQAYCGALDGSRFSHLKSLGPQGPGGSNPPPSAGQRHFPRFRSPLIRLFSP